MPVSIKGIGEADRLGVIGQANAEALAAEASVVGHIADRRKRHLVGTAKNRRHRQPFFTDHQLETAVNK